MRRRRRRRGERRGRASARSADVAGGGARVPRPPPTARRPFARAREATRAALVLRPSDRCRTRPRARGGRLAVVLRGHEGSRASRPGRLLAPLASSLRGRVAASASARSAGPRGASPRPPPWRPGCELARARVAARRGRSEGDPRGVDDAYLMTMTTTPQVSSASTSVCSPLLARVRALSLARVDVRNAAPLSHARPASTSCTPSSPARPSSAPAAARPEPRPRPLRASLRSRRAASSILARRARRGRRSVQGTTPSHPRAARPPSSPAPRDLHPPSPTSPRGVRRPPPRTRVASRLGAARPILSSRSSSR